MADKNIPGLADGTAAASGDLMEIARPDGMAGFDSFKVPVPFGSTGSFVAQSGETITVVAGIITAITPPTGPINEAGVSAPGKWYAAADTGSIDAGNNDAVYSVTSINALSGGVVLFVDQGTKTIRIDEDVAEHLPPTGTLDWSGSTGGLNDGTYTIVSATYDSGNDWTVVVVVEAIPSPIADGDIAADYGGVAEIAIDDPGTGYSAEAMIPTTATTGLGTDLEITVISVS